MSEPIRVLLNDRALCRTLTGVGNYIAQLLTHAPAHAPDVRIDPFYFTYLTREDWRRRLRPPDVGRAGGHHPGDLGDSRIPWWLRRTLQAGYRAAFRWAAGDYLIGMRSGLRQAGANGTRGSGRPGRYALYHEPNHIPMRCGLPTVTTIHDLSAVVHPEWHPDDRVRWYQREFDAGLRQTGVFLAASEFTKGEILTRLGVPAERIRVTYQAPRAAFRPRPPEEVAAGCVALGAGERFFLYVGTIEPRKNVAGLLDAYAALPSSVREQHPLVVAGAWGWKQQQLRQKLAERSLSAHVRLMGYLYDEQLAALYSACTALVWPTFYEGFGLPPLEAMACGAAVIVSNAASLPEVVGEAGVLLPPDDPAAWTRAMQRMAEDEEHRGACRRRSLEQARRFTWSSFIAETVAGYRQALLER
jgi:glycosyltransferase involved in cell wall biosynthesis